MRVHANWTRINVRKPLYKVKKLKLQISHEGERNKKEIVAEDPILQYKNTQVNIQKYNKKKSEKKRKRNKLKII